MTRRRASLAPPRAGALAAFALAAAGRASAHDLWIEPSTFRPTAPARVSAALRVGQRLVGEPIPRNPSFVERFVLKGRGGETAFDGAPGADPAGEAVVSDAGLHWIAYQSRPVPLFLDPEGFERYLKEEGLEKIAAERARRGLSDEDGRERFHRCAKALLDASGREAAARAGVVDVPLGLTLELVPGKNPYALRPSEALPLTLFFRGRPAAGVLVVAMRKGAAERPVSARTDAKGRVSLRVGEPGFWLVKAVQMEAAPADAGVDWESWWASITFELSAGAAR